MISSSSKKMLYGITCGSSVLGFYRGVGHYKYNYNDKMNNYQKKIQEKQYYSEHLIEKPNFFYYHCFLSGIFGMIIYINPITFLLMIPKELYRLEVNLRNMKDQKKSSYYNDIF